jgi:acyl-CoA hydrolase
LKAKRWQDSAAETVQVVLPNDSNPLGFILGGTVMHLIDITGAIACHRHTNTLALTAGVDSLDFIHPIKVGDLIILKSRVNCAFTTSLEVEVEVFSEEIQTGDRKLTSRAYLTFVSLDKDGRPTKVPPLIVDTPDDEARCRAAHERRNERLRRKRATD